ncbi:exonuclease SbcCD subunit D C-terminal domain-containing protein [Psychrobacter phenylpyruvicus]|uniref:Nuclease SbcCD subunit D n=1 Tax=Psychrobacter phenylpyruvicus TaxID=29432 RepID=A0A379LK27_9GAMM|nr:exonuclease SbcCD subunit D C-terminal domain-containing protein [Psychrobacter phenylpyruvicus]SUD90893.1 Nuclease sbcCD subunit D [Psychrobacter phenylpyruvicus]
MSNSSKHPTIKPLTVLHTSDWHLGRRLYGQMRYDEFEAFLKWLETTISHYDVDVLIVAGDIFDTMTPSNRAQSLYYEFLGRVSHSNCQHIVIVSGNHDSPTFLDAPSNVLKFLNVHVIGTACENLEDEVLTLSDNEGNPYCIVTAVPYLRDRDVRSSSAGESSEDKDSKVVAGIKTHYDSVADIAKTKQNEIRKQLKRHIPIIATGHLFASGGRTTDDDGVRNLYVGSLGKISADMFADHFDYVALGHLHVPQRVGGCEHIRYSGSPIAMGFGEASQQKQVLLVEFGDSINESTNASSDKTFTDTPSLSASTNKTSDITSQLSFEDKVNPNHQPQPDLFMDDLFADITDEPVEDDVNNNKPNQLANIDSDNSDEILSNTITPTTVYHDLSKQMRVVSVPVPTFQKLMQIKGDMSHIQQSIKALPKDESVWLEVIYNGNEIVSHLNEDIQALIEDTDLKALKVKNTNNYNKVLSSSSSTETLQDLNVMEVFERCMSVHKVADSQKEELREAYQQVLHEASHEDVNSGEV